MELIIAIIIMIESAGNPLAESPVGARGLMQITPIALKDVQQNVERVLAVPLVASPDRVEWAFQCSGSQALEFEDMWREEPNKLIGTCYLKWNLIRFNYNLRKALIAYNAGPSRAEISEEYLPKETRDYLSKFNRLLEK